MAELTSPKPTRYDDDIDSLCHHDRNRNQMNNNCDDDIISSATTNDPMSIEENDNSSNDVVWDTLHVLLQQELSYQKLDYFQKFTTMLEQQQRYDEISSSLSLDVDKRSREQMIHWFDQVIEFCNAIDPDCNVTDDDGTTHHHYVVDIATSYFDRFIGLSHDYGLTIGLCDSSIYQLIGITCLYIAIKIHQPKCLDISFFMKLSNGQYTNEQIVSLEHRILHTIKWKCHPPTTCDFILCIIRAMYEKIVEQHNVTTPMSSSSLSSSYWLDVIYELVLQQLCAAKYDYEFITMKPSMIVYCSSMNAIESISSSSSTFLAENNNILDDMHRIMNVYLDCMIQHSSNDRLDDERQIHSARRRLYESLVVEQKHQENMKHSLPPQPHVGNGETIATSMAYMLLSHNII